MCGELGTGASGWFKRRRFIPACAGNSTTRGAMRSRASVHPRVCGELSNRSARSSAPTGSSPRVRGTPAAQRHRRRAGRFIPACAGNSLMIAPSCGALAVHPRVCGELADTTPFDNISSGSSPRVRGTRGIRHAGLGPRRFIPACAGNSADTPHTATSSPVHPRVCGELTDPNTTNRHVCGSSPRVRGTLDRRMIAHSEYRFIPACAGNSGW